MKKPVYVEDDKIQMDMKQMVDDIAYPVEYHSLKYWVLKQGSIIDVYREK